MVGKKFAIWNYEKPMFFMVTELKSWTRKHCKKLKNDQNKKLQWLLFQMVGVSLSMKMFDFFYSILLKTKFHDKNTDAV